MRNSTILLAFITAFLLQACYDIDDNRRILVSGRIVDDIGNALGQIPVETRGNGNLLGTSVSDDQGNFSFTSLESNARDFTILLNPESAGDTLYTSIIYRNNPQASSDEPIEAVREQNLYDLGTVQLRQFAFLGLEIRRSTNASDTLYFNLQTTETFCEQFYTNDQLDSERANCFEQSIKSGDLLPEEQRLRASVRSVKRDTAVFRYRLNDQELQEVKIPINQYNTSYVFEF